MIKLNVVVDKGSLLVSKADKPFFSRLRDRLSRTRGGLFGGLGELFKRRQIDDEILEELETRLLMADVGMRATRRVIDHLAARVSRKELSDVQALLQALHDELVVLLQPCAVPLSIAGKQPFVVLMVGVNGVGKTTTIAKLAAYYKAEGRSLMLAAGDTFRAAAVEQLKTWGERQQVPVIAQHTGADSASVIFDAVQAARSRGTDLLIADTAGRLHTQDNLMEELKKIQRVMGKLDTSAPHEKLLVIDAVTGQNGLNQARQFHEAIGLTGLVITKLDGTAKGGILFAVAEELGLPVRFIGVGEGADDLWPFDPDAFVDALLSADEFSAG